MDFRVWILIRLWRKPKDCVKAQARPGASLKKSSNSSCLPISHWLAAIGVLLVAGLAWGDDRTISSIPVGTLTNIYEPTHTLPPTDEFYIQYFAKTDHEILLQYQDRWNYHEKEIPYAATEWNYEHLSLGSIDYGHAPYEGDVRHDFAQQVFRERLDSALREYFKDTEGARQLRHAQKTVNQLKSVPLRVSSGEHPGEFHIGYDVQSDASKFEYVQGPFQAGVYHSHLVAALTGQRQGQSDLSVRITASLVSLPTAALAYQPGNTVVEASLSKPLTRSVTTRIVSSTPTVAGAAPCNYRVEVSYQF